MQFCNLEDAKDTATGDSEGNANGLGLWEIYHVQQLDYGKLV